MTNGQILIGDMSHETAIGILKLLLEAMEVYDSILPTPERINALKMAIKALEQEPKSEWQKDHEILKAYSDGADEVLDKIRAEIENHCGLVKENHCRYCSHRKYCSHRDSVMEVREILEIIDKAGSEDKE